jgi:diadenosine tetraphosphatase ApaH/serine/threonine PP2A family protein phosphatase
LVVGNHDVAAVTGRGDETFNPDAKAAIGWTKMTLPEQDKRKLMQFPLAQEDGEMYFSHGSPEDISKWKYIFTQSDAKRGLAACPHQLIFVGHSHTPAIFVELEHKRMFGGEFRHVTRIIQSFVKIENGYRYIFDVGSVGQPRDGDPRACYGIYDVYGRRFEQVRVAYDIHRAADKIIKSGLPVNLAERLKIGR